MVYLVSTVRQAVCLTDGKGKTTRIVLEPNDGISTFGEAPWVLQPAAPGSLQIFFQGARVRVPTARWVDGRIGLEAR
jgi:hypothetical protein